MLYVGDVDIDGSEDHEGFVAGRYRNGALSDIWTDVRRCAEATFIQYLPACECGWVGNDRVPDASGYRSCEWAWIEHLTEVCDIAAAVERLGRELDLTRDFLVSQVRGAPDPSGETLGLSG